MMNRHVKKCLITVLVAMFASVGFADPIDDALEAIAIQYMNGDAYGAYDSVLLIDPVTTTQIRYKAMRIVVCASQFVAFADFEKHDEAMTKLTTQGVALLPQRHRRELVKGKKYIGLVRSRSHALNLKTTKSEDVYNAARDYLKTNKSKLENLAADYETWLTLLDTPCTTTAHFWELVKFWHDVSSKDSVLRTRCRDAINSVSLSADFVTSNARVLQTISTHAYHYGKWERFASAKMRLAETENMASAEYLAICAHFKRGEWAACATKAIEYYTSENDISGSSRLSALVWAWKARRKLGQTAKARLIAQEGADNWGHHVWGQRMAAWLEANP